MKEKHTVNKELLAGLQSDAPQLVTDTINKLAESGNSAYIPFLLELMQSTNVPEVKGRIVKLLSELKHSDAIPLMAEAIRDEKYHSDLKELVSSCWENSLDFSEHIILFVDLVINKDFLVAFEAFTVIENLESKIEPAVQEKALEKINNALPSITEDKRPLLEELIILIPKLPL